MIIIISAHPVLHKCSHIFFNKSACLILQTQVFLVTTTSVPLLCIIIIVPSNKSDGTLLNLHLQRRTHMHKISLPPPYCFLHICVLAFPNKFSSCIQANGFVHVIESNQTVSCTHSNLHKIALTVLQQHHVGSSLLDANAMCSISTTLLQYIFHAPYFFSIKLAIISMSLCLAF